MNSHLESLGRLRLQALLILLVVFVIGGLSGIAFERAGDRQPERRPPPPGGMRGLPPDLAERLDLQPQQETRIDGILERYRARTDAVLDQYLPRLREMTDSLRVEVRAELTPEQRVVFDQLEKERPRHPHGPDDRGGPPPDHRPDDRPQPR